MRSESCVALQKFHSVVRYIVLTNMCLDWISITSSGSELLIEDVHRPFTSWDVMLAYAYTSSSWASSIQYSGVTTIGAGRVVTPPLFDRS